MANPKDRVTNNLVALGSAAVFTVYVAGFVRTRPAAQRFAQQAERRPAPATQLAAETPASVPTPVDRAEAPPTPAIEKPTVPTKDAAVASSAPKPVGPVDSATTPVVVAPPATTAPAEPIAAPAAIVTPTPASPPAPAHDSSRAATATAAPDSTQGAAKEKTRLKDGIFFGWGTSRHGDIQAGIEIKNGRIISAFISECLTQYSCSWIAVLPQQVIGRQSAEVDYISGATQSSNAFYYAVTDALKKAK